VVEVFKMKAKTNKAWLLIVGILLIGGMAYIFSQPQSVFYGGTGTTFFDNNRQAWVIDVYLNNLDTAPGKVIFSTTQMQADSKKAGNELKPQDSETVDLELTKKQCVYTIEPLYTLLGNGYYKVFNPQPYFEIKATAESTGQSRTFSLDTTQPVEVVSAKRGGQITAATTGVEWRQYCYIPDNSRILKIGSKYSILDSDKATALGVKTVTCGGSFGIIGLATCFFTGIIKPEQALDNNFYQNFKDITFDLKTLKATPVKPIATVHVILTADKEYFNAQPVAVLPPAATPKIVSSTCGAFTSGSQSSMKVVVNNVGTTGEVMVEANSDKLTIEPSATTATIQNGAQKTYYFVVKPTNVAAKENYVVDIIASSTQQLGTSNKVTSTCTGTISPVPLLPPKDNVCGNSKCDETENYQTCPVDCKTQQCNPDKLEFLNPDSGKCECPEGFMRDDKGICAERSDNFALIIILVIAVIAVIMILLLRGKPQTGRGGLI
jgi:hypothetical protein